MRERTGEYAATVQTNKGDMVNIDIYCIKCKKRGRLSDIVEPDGSFPFVYDGSYECNECKQRASFTKSLHACPTCGRS